MNMSPGQAAKKGKLGSRTGLVTKLYTSSEKMSNDAVTKKEKEDDKTDYLGDDKSGPGSVESGSASMIPQGGPETKKSPPVRSMDNEKSVIGDSKPAESNVSEKQKQMPAETVPLMPDGQDGLSNIDDVKDVSTSAKEPIKNEEEEGAIARVGDVDTAGDKETTKQKVEERPPTNGTAKDIVALETEPDLSMKDGSSKDASGAQAVGVFGTETNVANIIDHAPEPIPPAEKAETKTVEAPLQVGPPQESPEPPGEKENGAGKYASVPDPVQPADVPSNIQSPPVLQLVVDNTPEQPTESASPPFPPAEADAGAEAQRVMEQFTSQLQRIEENFEAERKEMNQQHQINIQQTIASKEQEKEQLLGKMKEKDLKIRDLKRTKEGNELRMDSLKREVEGIKKLLEER